MMGDIIFINWGGGGAFFMDFVFQSHNKCIDIMWKTKNATVGTIAKSNLI